MESVLLRDPDTQKVYQVNVTAEEAKKLLSDRAVAMATLKTIKENENMYFGSEDRHDVCGSEAPMDNTMDIAIEEEAFNTEGEASNAEVEAFHGNEEMGVFKWPHEAILLLIEEYALRQEDFHSGKLSQKKLWSLIAQELQKCNYNLTGPQSQSKFAGLKRTYKSVKDHNSKSGNGTRTWPYYTNMDTLLGDKPFMAPICTVSSTGAKTLKRTSEESAEASTSTAERVSKKRQQSSSIEDILQDFKEERKKAEDAMQRRHEDNQKMQQSLLQSLNKLIDVYQKK